MHKLIDYLWPRAFVLQRNQRAVPAKGLTQNYHCLVRHGHFLLSNQWHSYPTLMSFCQTPRRRRQFGWLLFQMSLMMLVLQMFLLCKYENSLQLITGSRLALGF